MQPAAYDSQQSSPIPQLMDDAAAHGVPLRTVVPAAAPPAAVPDVLYAAVHSLTAGIVTLVVFAVYTQAENHFLNPAVMSRTVRPNPPLGLVSVLVAGAIGHCLGGTFGAVAVLLAIPAAVSLHIAVREIWRATSAGQTVPAEPQGDASPDLS